MGEGWRALQDVSKVKLKVLCSLSLCGACICMAIVRPHMGSIIAISLDLNLWSLQFGSTMRLWILKDRDVITEMTVRNETCFPLISLFDLSE